MNKNKEVLIILKNQLLHYKEVGMGGVSKFSKTIVTPRLVRETFNRYIELGGTLDFISNTNDTEYKEFMEEIECC